MVKSFFRRLAIAMLSFALGCGGGKGLQPPEVPDPSDTYSETPLAIVVFANGAQGTYVLPSATTPVTISWQSTGATSCSVSDGSASLASGIVGSYSIPSGTLGSGKVFAALCHDKDGNVAVAQVRILIPSVSISANGMVNALSVAAGTLVSLVWSSSSATSCSGSSDNGAVPFNVTSTSGSQNLNVSSNTKFTVDCVIASQHVTAMVAVTIAAPLATLTITANGQRGLYVRTSPYEPLAIDWLSTGTDPGSCNVLPVSQTGSSGSYLVPGNGPMQDTPYTLSCKVAGQPISATVLVGIVPGVWVTANNVLGSYVKGLSDVTLSWISVGMVSCKLTTPVTINATEASYTLLNASITATTDYTVTCNTGTQEIVGKVTVVIPSVTITANGVTGEVVKDAQDITIAWTSSGTTGCVLAPSGATGTAGTVLVPNASLVHTTTYAVGCLANGVPITASVRVHVFGPSISLWTNMANPWRFETDTDATGGLELGMKFRVSQPGKILGVRFYKHVNMTGMHRGTLWNKSTKAILQSVTFTGESSSGWQQANFATPVAVDANTTYIISYYSTSATFPKSSSYNSSTDSGRSLQTSFSNGPLRSLADGEDGGNGVYKYGNGSATPLFPTNTYDAGNYWVDVVFSPEQL